MYNLIFYVPFSHLDIVKNALFSAGAGKYKNYEMCSWEVKGEGQFKPMEGSNPFVGTKFNIEKVMEYKVEMICEETIIENVIEALKKNHPYEEPAYHYYKIFI